MLISTWSFVVLMFGLALTFIAPRWAFIKQGGNRRLIVTVLTFSLLATLGVQPFLGFKGQIVDVQGRYAVVRTTSLNYELRVTSGDFADLREGDRVRVTSGSTEEGKTYWRVVSVERR